MCGRFAFYSPSEATAALFGVRGALDVEARYNIAPTQYIAAVRAGEDEERELVMLRWGLIPFWAKDPKIRAPIQLLPAYANSTGENRAN